MAHIYIVDDEPDVCESLTLLLEAHGHRVVSTRQGKDVLSYVRSLKPELVILDILLPDVDGMKLLEGLAEDPDTAAIPVILISALGQKRKIIEGLEKGAIDYVPKPWHQEVLLARVDAALMRKQLDKARRRNRSLSALPETAGTVAREMAGPVMQIINCLNELEAQHGDEMGQARARLEHARESAQSIMNSLNQLGGWEPHPGGKG